MLQFSVPVYQRLLLGWRGLQKIDFQNVHEGRKCRCPCIVQTVVERQCIALPLEFVASRQNLLIRR